ncbi:hypothetical protein LCGC14_1254090 [marine sediment metagenome]|uniref:Uncharacterized protein n=1 Tax=marine sediment metagenome TaxID=412755 RepID=A0A0F9P643_9ZZZZ
MVERIWVKDTRWRRLPEPKRCRFIGGTPKTHCPNTAEFGIKRSNGIWAYCLDHMYGRRIRDGLVELDVLDDSPAARAGYV